MYALEQKKRFLNKFANLIIWLFEALSFSFVWCRNYEYTKYERGNISAIGLYIVFIYIITKSFNGYKISYLRLSDLWLSHSMAIVLAGIAGYLFACMVWGSYVDVLPMVSMVIVQVFFSLFWVSLIRFIMIKAFPPRKVIIIYGNYPLDAFLQKLKTRGDKYEICEILNYQKGYEKICQDVLDFEGVFLYDLPSEERNEIIKYCVKHSIRTYIVPKITDIIMKASDDLYLVDTPIFLSRNYGLSLDERFFKRFTDMVVSLIAIIILSPVMLIVALIIKLYDRGPIFYKQLRLTRDGKMFMIYKFRSMRVDAEDKGAQLAKKKDSRVTPVGRVLRNLHLDELPQLFNVLKGDMAIVGPRPERPEIFLKYEKDIPQFDFRLKVKAGLTGYAQVYGKYNTTPIDKLKMDLIYVQDYSYFLDIKLMLLTFKIIFRKETSEGVDEDQKTALPSPSEYKYNSTSKKYNLNYKKNDKNN